MRATLAWLVAALAGGVDRRARKASPWTPQRELEALPAFVRSLNASARVSQELARTVAAYPAASSTAEALRLARLAFAQKQHFVLLWENRVFCDADHLHAEKHKIHYMFGVLASIAQRRRLPNCLFVWDQGARGTGCPPAAPEVPCLVIAKLHGFGAPGILVPNPYFCHVAFWDERSARIRDAAAKRPFAQRDPRLFWRGGVTRSCNPGNVARVSALSLTADDEAAFDVRCTSCVPPQGNCPSTAASLKHKHGGARAWKLAFPSGHDAFNYTKSMRGVGDSHNRSWFVEPHDFSLYKYVLNLPGTMGGSYSRNLNYLWLLGSAVFLWDSPAVEWYYPALRHGATHVSVTRASAPKALAKLATNQTKATALAAAASDVHDAYLCGDCLERYWLATIDQIRTRQSQAQVLDHAHGSLLHEALRDVNCETLREFALVDDATGAPMNTEHDFFGGHPGTLRALDDWDDLKFACLASKAANIDRR